MTLIKNHRLTFALVVFFFFYLDHHPLHAHLPDGIEHMYGASYTNAAIGNSGLSANFSADGTLSVLLWPTPSYFEHMDCTTAATDGTKGEHDNTARHLLYFGAKPNECSYAGLVVMDMKKMDVVRKVTWFRDASWKTEQTYFNEDTNVLLTTHRSDPFGITVKDITLIHAERDILARHYEITQDKNSTYKILKFVYFAHLAPKDTFSQSGFVTEFANDSNVRCTALFDENAGAVFYFPRTGEAGALVSTLPLEPTKEQLENLLKNLKSAANIYIGFDTPAKDDEHQIGFDALEEKAKEPKDAREDSMDDGTLSGSSFAPRKATTAMAKPISIKPGEKKSVTVYFSFGKTADEAKSLLKFARSKSFESHLKDTNAWWKNWLSRAALPKTKNPLVRIFSKRALMTLRTGYDKTSGGIVASVSTNPPYHFDWPRDGAFFDVALNVAGYNEMVNQHHRFLAGVIRKNNGDYKPLLFETGNAATKYDYTDILGPSPKGSFAMNYYTNGMLGGPIQNEIDQTGLTLWTWWENLKWVKDKNERNALAKNIYPSVILAAENLTMCKDETSGLQCYANEDDNLPLSQSMAGAMPAWMGLNNAVKFARFMSDEEHAVRWENRKNELGDAIIKHLYNAGDTPPHFQGGRGGTWLLWPAWFLDANDPRMENQAEWISRQLVPIMEKKITWSQYDAVKTSTLAVYYHKTKNSEKLAFIEKAILFMLENMPTKGVLSLGEGTAFLDKDGDGTIETFENRVAPPHIEESTLFYLTFMALYNTEDFERSDSMVLK